MGNIAVFVLFSHIKKKSFIVFSMFYEEIKTKFLSGEALAPFTYTVYGDGLICVSGYKAVTFYSPTEIKLRIHKGTLAITGEGLKIAEAGGGEIVIKGKISCAQIM